MCSAAEGLPVLSPSDPVQLRHLNSLEQLLLMNKVQAIEIHDKKNCHDAFPLSISALKCYGAFHSAFWMSGHKHVQVEGSNMVQVTSEFSQVP